MPSPHPPCIACGSAHVAEIMFGFPSDIAGVQERIERGEVILGGCDVQRGMPKWHCKACRHEWGISDWEPYLEKGERDQKQKEEETEQAALARGTMTATANEHGWVKCPHCHTRFSIRHTMSWDGTMHTSCRTRLEIVDAGKS